jgi:hypothetical protein
MNSTPDPHEKLRRSTRIRAQIPFRLTSLDPEIPFSETCHTLVVNTQGCGVRLSQELKPGMPVWLGELPTGKIVKARIANCVSLGAEGKYWLVGIALDEPGNIWGIRPAPADWGSDTAMAAAAAAPDPAQKKKEWPYSLYSNRGEAHPGKK